MTSTTEKHTMTLQEKYNVLYKALDAIVKLDENSCEKYVAKADSLAIDAIVIVDCAKTIG